MEEAYGARSASSASDQTEAEPKSVDESNDGDMANTAIVSNDILSPEGEPLKEGDEIVVRVVKNYGDESEIEYAPKEGGDKTPEEPMDTASRELTAMSGEEEGY